MGADRRRRAARGCLQRRSSTPEGVDRAFKKLDTHQEGHRVVGSRRAAAGAARQRRGRHDQRLERPHRQRDQGRQELQDRVGLPGVRLGPLVDPGRHQEHRCAPTTSSSTPAIRRTMSQQSKYIAYAPTHVDAIALVDPAIAPTLPTYPDNMKTADLDRLDVLGRQQRRADQALQRLAGTVTTKRTAPGDASRRRSRDTRHLDRMAIAATAPLLTHRRRAAEDAAGAARSGRAS